MDQINSERQAQPWYIRLVRILLNGRGGMRRLGHAKGKVHHQPSIRKAKILPVTPQRQKNPPGIMRFS
jgi:hypothetical protein